MGWLDRFRGTPETAGVEKAPEPEAPAAAPPAPRTPLKVGWLFRDEAGSMVLFEPEEIPVPERMRSVEMNKKHAKSASRCPAVKPNGKRCSSACLRPCGADGAAGPDCASSP